MLAFMKESFVPFLAVWVLLQSARGQDATVLEVENVVQAAKGGQGAWINTHQNDSLAVRDRIRTRQRSRATVRLTDL